MRWLIKVPCGILLLAATGGGAAETAGEVRSAAIDAPAAGVASAFAGPEGSGHQTAGGSPSAPGSDGAPMRAAPREGSAAGLRDGWPVFLGTPGAGFPYTPTLYDIDGDGAAEIFLTGGHTFALRGNGTFLPGWPTVEMEHMGYGTNDNMPGPSAADMDGDGVAEVLWSQRDWWAGSSRMWCFNGKRPDGSNLDGFPQQAPDEPSNALSVPFVLGDTDGDGHLEAWGPHTLGNTGTHYLLSGFDHQGTRLFTTSVARSENLLSLYFGDLDGDGAGEMFAVGWLSPDYRLHVFTADGGEAYGYPITLHTLTSGWLPFGPPVPVDLDGDGDLEILLGHWDSAGSRVLAYHHDGAPCGGFPVEIATGSQLFYFSLGDLTGDGVPELIAADNQLSADYRMHALDLATGLPLPGWPLHLTAWPEGFPAVGDVTGDGLQEVCFVTAGGELYAVAGTGQVVPGYPRMMSAPSISGVAIGDIDGDGLFELVAATWNGWVYAWNTPAPALAERADWPMRNIDARNTGVFGQRGGASVDARPQRAGLRLAATPSVSGGGLILRALGAAGPLEVDIIGTDGRRLERLVLAGSAPLAWRAGPRLPAGVYGARPAGGAGEAVRFLLVR
ncbi:MAG: VCBS repeat-containing protein [Candidatus Eisenbacteria bacterium]|uniref:VCBS repeat-containing protein n=1 Tax=Eiseniibacteriota bacterium TaxID=2212470 RepID=A0A937X6Q4_UNCEI|nr:VCBS repeat-containing protein [Candidatus Eisenbacteria bacterium]